MSVLQNAAAPRHLGDLIDEIGVPADRVRHRPAPGTATIEDWLATEGDAPSCELVDGTLVDKAMGLWESLIGLAIGQLLRQFVRSQKLGYVVGADGFVRLLGQYVRAPDVAVYLWSSRSDRKIPSDRLPTIVPDLAVEVLSVGNTRAEMTRKRHEYFHAGVRLVWMVDPRQRTVAVYTSVSQYEVLGEGDTLGGGTVLPGLRIDLTALFAELDDEGPPAAP